MRILGFENTYVAFLLLAFLGLGFWGSLYYVQHPSQFTRPFYSTTEISRARDLSHRLHRLEFENAHLESEVAELSLKTSKLYEDSSYQEAQHLARFTDLVQQEGDGVELVVKDNSQPVLLGDNPNIGIVHNTDLVQIVNALWAAGAEAISINGQPISSVTSITCAGPTILINHTRVASPFIIDALGDSQKILEALNKSSSFLNALQKYGIQSSIKAKDVLIPAYSQEMDAFEG